MALAPPASDRPLSPSIKPRLFAYYLYLESLWTFALSQGKMLKPLNISHSPGEKSTESLARLTQLVLTLIIGTFACIALLLLFTPRAQSVQAAPPARPLADIMTGGITVTHTSSTTHQMSVFRDGRITDQYFTDNSDNQIGTNISATTIAVMFDEHISPTVDVGSQLEFSATTPITLNTASSIPGYSEDSYVVYASRVISYEITQRTLATNTHNCVIMELVIRNTGSITTLTGGKLLYMMDIDAGRFPNGDKGSFDPARRLVYHTDYNGEAAAGYAMGISLLEGDLRGYGIMTDTHPNFPDPRLGDARIRDELSTPLVSPTDVITVATADTGTINLVSWLVANIPDLVPEQATTLAFGLCARSVDGEDEESTEAAAEAAVFDTFSQLVNLSVSKTATPTADSSIVAGEPITYSIAISNTGYRYVNNIIVTDTVPASTDLITYSVSQGSITASNRLITATIGRLYPTSGTVTVTLVVAPSITSTNGTVISNQAFIKSEPIITNTNTITHQIINAPVLTVTKRADPEPVASAGEVLTYTIVISCGGQGYATGVFVSDTLPANTDFVTDSITLDPPIAGITGTVPPALASDVTITAGQSVTVSFAVTVTTPLTDGTIITNTVSVTSTQVPTPTIAAVTSTVTAAPDLQIIKSSTHTIPLQPGDTITYTIVVSNSGNANATGVVISDTPPVNTKFITGSITLDPPRAGITGTVPPTLASDVTINTGQSVTVTFVVTASTPLAVGTIITNTAAVTSTEVSTPRTDTVTDTVSNADLSLTKTVYNPTPDEGDTIVYIITVSNGGPDDATRLFITDTLPTSLSYLSSSASQGTYTSTTRLWNVGSLAASDVATLTITATVDAGTGGTIITNTAEVYAVDQADPDSTPNNHEPAEDDQDSAAITVQSADLEVSKGVDNSTPNEGDTIVYTITVSNGGPNAATGVVLTDTLPAGVTHASHSASQGSYNSGSGRWNVGGLTNGSVATLTITATVDAGTAGQTITNTADGLSADQADPNTGNNTDSVDITVEYSPALSIVKNGPDIANVGNTVVFTFTVSHAGTSDGSPISNVSVTDTIASTPTLVSGDTNSSNELDAGETWLYTASYTIHVSDPDPLVNTGTVTGEDRDGDHITATDAHTTTLRGFAPALNIVKEGLTTAKVGDTVVFTFTVANVSFTPTSIKANANGDGSPISNVTVIDTIANPVNYVDGDDGDGLLEMGECWVYTASYTIQATDPDPLVNTGTVTGQDGDGDPINDTDTHSTTIEGRANFVFLPTVLKDY